MWIRMIKKTVGAIIRIGYRCIYRLAAVYFFLYTLARDNVSVNAHTYRKNDTCDTGYCQRKAV